MADAPVFTQGGMSLDRKPLTLNAAPAAVPSIESPLLVATPLRPLTSFESMPAAIARMEAEHVADALKTDPVRNNLLTWLIGKRQEAIDARDTNGITRELLDCQRRRAGEYDAAYKADLIAHKVFPFWAPVTRTKCWQLEQWLREYFNRYGERCWTADSSPEPSLPEDFEARIKDHVQQIFFQQLIAGYRMSPDELKAVETGLRQQMKAGVKALAKARAQLMALHIDKQLAVSEFNNVLDEFFYNLATYGTAFLVGPEIKMAPQPAWDHATGTSIVNIVPISTFSSPSPHDMYLESWSKNWKEGWVFERRNTFRQAFEQYRDTDYWNQDELVAYLDETHDSNTTTQNLQGDHRRATLENNAGSITDNRAEHWRAQGALDGKRLKDWNSDDFGWCEDRKFYSVDVIFTETHVLKVAPNWDNLEENDVFARPLFERPGSPWGIGMPMAVKSAQDKCNGSSVALMRNMNWASGPMGWEDATRIHPDDIGKWGPAVFKRTNDDAGVPMTSAPMGFLIVPSIAAQLQAIYKEGLLDADRESGIPAYQFGGSPNTGAAQNTVSGYSMALTASSRGITDVMGRISRKAVGPSIQRLARQNNLYADDPKYGMDPEIKGDCIIEGKGPEGFISKEMLMNGWKDFLNQTANPTDIQIWGQFYPKMRIGIQRKMAQTLMLDIDDLFPPESQQMGMPAVEPEKATGGQNTAGTPPNAQNNEVPAGAPA